MFRTKKRSTYTRGRGLFLLACLAISVVISLPTNVAAWNHGWGGYGYHSGYGSGYWGGGYGTAMHLGNFTYYDAPGMSITAQRIGNFTYYDGYNYNTGQSISGTAQRIGNFTYYDW